MPAAFVAIFGTVVLYGLTATLAARLLGVAGTGAETILLVGGHTWVRAIAQALKAAGMEVRLWTDRREGGGAARPEGGEAGGTPRGGGGGGEEAGGEGGGG